MAQSHGLSAPPYVSVHIGLGIEDFQWLRRQAFYACFLLVVLQGSHIYDIFKIWVVTVYVFYFV